jgi:exopolyphosphatase/guanosine-5'-triphosphate,3'-diphosphate pyrophosphatase
MTVASIDIGTNTILLLIAEVDVNTGEINTLANHYNIPRVGQGLKPGLSFPAENLKRMFSVLDSYMKIISEYNCEKIIFTATNAFRVALNSLEIKNEVEKRYGVKLDIISGGDECKYSFWGATNTYKNNKNYIVIDIGGGSTEIIYGTKKEILFNKSFPVGVVSWTENFFKSDPPGKNEIEYTVSKIKNKMDEIKSSVKLIDKTIAIAGTPTTLACIKLGLKDFDEEKVEGSELNYNEIENFIYELSNLSSAEILKRYSPVVKGREDVLLAGTIILKTIMEILNLKVVEVSTKGIRYGAVVNWINLLN